MNEEEIQVYIDAMKKEIADYEKQMRKQDSLIKYLVLACLIGCIFFYCNMLAFFGY